MIDRVRRTVVLVDDHPLRAAAFVGLLRPWAERHKLELEAATMVDAVDELADAAMVILSVGGAALDGAVPQFARVCRERAPSVPVAVLAEGDDLGDVASAFRFGAAGYLTSSLSRAAVENALTFLLQNGRYYPPDAVLGYVADAAERVDCVAIATPSPVRHARPLESEVLALLRLGRSNNDIAAELDQPAAMVKQVVRRLMEQSGAANRTQVAIWAQHGA